MYPDLVTTPKRRGAAEVVKTFRDPNSSVAGNSAGTHLRDISSIPEASQES